MAGHSSRVSYGNCLSLTKGYVVFIGGIVLTSGQVLGLVLEPSDSFRNRLFLQKSYLNTQNRQISQQYHLIPGIIEVLH